MESIFSVIKDNNQLILLFSILVILKNIITFLTAKPLERQLFSKEKKLLYDLINILTVFIFVPTIIFLILFQEEWFIILITKIFLYLVILIFIQSIIIIIKNRIVKLRLRRLVKLKVFLLNQKFEIVSFILIYLNIIIIFGSFNASLLIETMNLNIKIILILVILALELYIVYSIFIWDKNILLTKPILVSIKMEDGTIYEKYYIYHPSDNNFILIGKDKNHYQCKTPILIRVDKILSCQQVNAITSEFTHNKD